VVAYTTRATGAEQLWLAQRGPAGWSTVRVDSSGDGIGEPGLALDGLGRVRIAVRHRGGPEGYGLYFIEAPSPSGPFTWTRADSGGDGDANVVTHASIALDPVTGDPRIVHVGAFSNRYATRTEGSWSSIDVDPDPEGWSTNWQRVASLALDGAGNPRILSLGGTWVLSTSSPAAEPACSGVATWAPWYFERDQPTGNDLFSATYLGEHDGEASPDAVACSGARTHLVWIDTAVFSCWPSRIIYNQSPLVLSVPPPRVQTSALRLGPNPLRSGGALHLWLSPVRDAPVTFHVEDVAGRRVASRDVVTGRGESSVAWTLPVLRPGWYHVRAKQGATLLGSAPLLVLD
jgi:hypothetical protein